MGADGSGVRRLPEIWGEYPAWSPDGERIAFASFAGGVGPTGDPNYDLFVVNADGSGLRRLSQSPAYDMYPTWSPDGESIAFESTRATSDDFEPPARNLSAARTSTSSSPRQRAASRRTSRATRRDCRSFRTGRPTAAGSRSTRRASSRSRRPTGRASAGYRARRSRALPPGPRRSSYAVCEGEPTAASACSRSATRSVDRLEPDREADQVRRDREGRVGGRGVGHDGRHLDQATRRRPGSRPA